MVSPRRTPRPIQVDSALAGLQQVFPNNALKMHRRSGLILRDENVVPVFMLQPMLALERGHKPLTPMEQKLFDFDLQANRPNYEAYAHRAAQYIASQEQTMAKEIGGEFIDLTGIYAGVPEQIYTDYVHLTPAGNARLAAYVAQRLLPVITRDASRKSILQAPVIAQKLPARVSHSN
jgi:hypothetical protein